jgi:hypothetical protein
MNKMTKFKNNLIAQAEANPLVAITIGVAALTACAKLMDANTARMAAKTHAAEVARRIANSK